MPSGLPYGPPTPMQKPQRIYLVGAHSTGKTTLARWIRDTYGIPMISEVARGVLAEMEAQLDSMRSDVNLVNRYQMMVFERQLEAENDQDGSFVSDRAFCNLAYAAQHATILPQVFADKRLGTYMDSVREGIVFFLRPHRELLAADGVRERTDWEEVLRIDGMVKLLLEMFDVPYVPMASLPMQERVRLIERVLHLGGMSPADQGTLRPLARRDSERKIFTSTASTHEANGSAGSPQGNGMSNGKRSTEKLQPSV
ncbi:MAG: putative ATPase [Planctomycetota bacterium]|jgi:predicted ATPase